jgi:hypothetical protein
MAVSVVGILSLISITATEPGVLASRNLKWHHSAQQIQMRKVIVIIVVAGLLLSGWLVYARYEARVAQFRAAQAKRDAAYQGQLDRFQHDVRLGMHRAEVKSYLDSKKVSYVQMNSNLAVNIGEDPANEWFCDRWDVYVEFRFSHLPGQTEPLPLDNLDGISIQRIGHCL